jgi:hypothetical protein
VPPGGILIGASAALGALVFGGCYALLLFLRHTIERRTWEAVFSEQPWQRPSDEPTRRERNG